MIDIEEVKLTVGNHASIEAGACVMELSSYLAHEPWSDRPACVSGVIGAFLRAWNDQLDDAGRQRLKPYAARVIGTAASPEVESRRAWLATDWMCRTHLPAWLDLGGMPDQAAAVRALPPITEASVGAAQPVLSEAGKRSAAARDAAWDAARGAAWGAARGAAWIAARAAARDAAWDAARGAAWGAARGAAWIAARDAAMDAARAATWDATWAAARIAAWDAARDATWDAAWDAAWAAAAAAARIAAWIAAGNAAWDAAWDAAGAAAGAAAGNAAWDAALDAAGDAARDAAGNAAGNALAPTVISLRASAFQLLDAMIAEGGTP